MKEGSFFSKIAKIKGIGYILIGIVAGVFLLLLPSGSVSKSAEPATTAEEYRIELEKSTRELLNGIDGVGDCRVMITLEYGFEYLYASNQKYSESQSESGYITKEIEKTLVTVSADGNEKTVLVREKPPVVSGIAVVCKGADYAAQYRIAELLTALFGIDPARISIQT